MLVACRLVFLLRLVQFHLDIEHWLLHSFLLLAGHLEIEAPVEIIHFSCACELVLHVCLCKRCACSHLLKQKRFDLFLHGLWQFFCKYGFVLRGHTECHVLHEQIVQ